ncbi:hypothetical protein SDC9_07351 [bioreactor metagenome]|uniref:Elp3/MiaA/NifB-like radical SAM core domain-containing protein n=1 Tax=bioreactor metagenome TaxID=1076179 RepID=A0A644T4L8_9ZZZZ|nr:radical SAM protein [Methanobrevibacter sp.]MEA4956808.1 radical SAM protein [Methanobrevibacter sp.]
MGDYSLNPYIGCSFNCEYCYINGSKYVESTDSFYIKSNALQMFKNQLKRKAKASERAVILFGSATDPYMNIEKELLLTRNLLNVANRFKFPVHIVTKSDLVLRDIEIFKKININGVLPKDLTFLDSKVMITFSFSSLDNEIAKIFEPNAPSPKKRLKAIKILKDEGFLVGASLMPLLPFISDSDEDIDKIFSVLNKIGVDYIFGGPLTLFGESNNDSKIKYYKIIDKNFPNISEATKQIFKEKEYPNINYQKNVYKKLGKACNKYKIKNSII